MPDLKERLPRVEFDRIVDALAGNEISVGREVERDPAFPFKRGIHDETFLHFFVVESCPDLVRELAHYGASVEPENEFGNTPLMECTLIRNIPMLELLLALGADPNYQSSRNRRAALHHAAEYANQDAVTILMKAGARCDLPDNFDDTPMDLIKSYGLSADI